ncbi:hypothetical protein CL657_02350 [bacterium]|nr:hypothetical protein [bacterium]
MLLKRNLNHLSKYSYYFVLKNIFFLIVAFTFTISNIYSEFKTHFKYILPLSYPQLHLQFPHNPVKNIHTIDLAMIKKNQSPKFWPHRIPFVAGISNNQTKLFYYQFEPLGFSKLIDIPIDTPPIIDVAVMEDGGVFSITSSNLYTHNYDFDLKSIQLDSKLPLKDPLKCSTNHINKVAILFKNSIQLYRYKTTKRFSLLSVSEQINSILKDHSCKNLSITSSGYLLILTESNILFFSPNGILLQSVPNTGKFDLVDFTSFGDYILGSSSYNRLAKYSPNGFLLFESSFLKPAENLKELAIYQPYGNLCLISNEEGAYYSMTTSLTIQSGSYSLDNHNQLSIKTSFLLTFPSIVSIQIRDSDSSIMLTKEKKLTAGIHHLNWDKLDPKFQNKSIQVTAKGLYSESNTVDANFKLVESL